MRILVTGAAGMLGRDLIPILEDRHDVTGVDLADFNIVDVDECRRAMGDWRPDVVVNCAAYTDVDRCEEHVDLAMDVNGHAPGYIARACQESGARLVHLSTDYVFDGEKDGPYVEDDAPGPLSAYGRSKLVGEEAVRREMESGWTIVRAAWLFGRHGRNFVDAIRRIGREKEYLTVVDDQIGCPTYAVDLAQAIVALIEQRSHGIYHAVGSGIVSWRGFAIEILRQCGIDKEIRPLTTAELGRPARRPRNSALSTAKLERATGYCFRPWKEALAAYLELVGA